MVFDNIWFFVFFDWCIFIYIVYIYEYKKKFYNYDYKYIYWDGLIVIRNNFYDIIYKL